MDPISAWALAVKAVAEMITEIVKGQPQEFKAKAWERWDADLELVRAWFKATPPKKP